jgi:hypothetical protein
MRDSEQGGPTAPPRREKNPPTENLDLAGLFSLLATCEANGVNPERYLADVLPCLSSHPNARLDELLPHRWKPVDSS